MKEDDLRAELSAIKKRLTTLEGQLMAQRDLVEAIRLMLFSALQQLHVQKTLPLQAVIADLQSGTLFAQAAFDISRPPQLAFLIQALQTIQDAYGESDTPPTR